MVTFLEPEEDPDGRVMAALPAQTSTVDVGELLAQAGWVRSIVRRLVLDEGMAEDVLQETWIAALERPAGAPEAAEERGGVRAWLAAVARNLALRRRRREALRAAGERMAARPEPIDGGQGELERMQLQRALVDAVLALEEPYRSAVILRHLDGLPAGEIARRQGCTSVAARQRVRRGLARLRVALAERFEGPQSARALVAWLGPGRSPGAGACSTHFTTYTTLAGGALVSTKVTLGVACGVLAALALWMLKADEGRPGGPQLEATDGAGLVVPGTRSGGAGLAASAAPAPEAAAPSESLADIGRESLEHAPSARPAALALQGRVTDTRGQPLADAHLALAGIEPPVELVSDAEGRVTAELARAALQGAPLLRVACEGYVARELTLDLTVPFTIQLESLPALVGRVLDPEGRAAAPPGYVTAQVIDARTRASLENTVELGADGSYRLEALPLGRLVSVEARARGFGVRKLAQDLVLEPDRTTALDLVLEHGAVLTGTVLDARTREPIPGATVWVEGFAPEPDSVHPMTTADGEGRFRLEGVNEEVSHQGELRTAFFWLVAKADGYAASPVNGYGAQANDEHAYDFEMLLEPAECALRVEVVFADGRPAAGATVWAIDALSNPFFESADGRGEHRFEGLPAGPLGLWLECEDTLPVATEGTALVRVVNVSRGKCALRVDLELAPGEERAERFVLRPPDGAALAGRVVDLEGRGVPEFRVRAQLSFQLGNLILASGWEELRTGADGSYRFEGLHAGQYQVWASGEGTSMACAQPAHTYVELGREGRTEVEDLMVGPCLTIEGRIAGDGLELAALELAARDPASGAELAGTRAAPDGSFRFDPLVAREYVVVLLRDGKELDRSAVGPANASGLFLRAR